MDSSLTTPPQPIDPNSCYTGNQLLMYIPGAHQEMHDLLMARNFIVTNTRIDTVDSATLSNNDSENSAIVFHNLNIAAVSANSDILNSVRSADFDSDTPIIIYQEAERFLYGSVDSTLPTLPDGVWGLYKTGVLSSPLSGKSIRLAIIDSGIDLSHPDFQGRNISYSSFCSDETVEDLNGHGTHCAGIACSNVPMPGDLRYGIATNADLFVGKALSTKISGTPRGKDSNVLAAINWAVENGCNIISMSLSTPVAEGTPFSQIYENLAKTLLDSGILIVAAAGNNSFRNFVNGPILNPVNHPANCPSIMAVGAVTSTMEVANFSARGTNDPSTGGSIDIVAPGVEITSSWSTMATHDPNRYLVLSGTSQATPHVSGIAALYAESDQNLRGRDLWNKLITTAQPLPSLDPRDVGAGLVKAPQTGT